MTDPVTTEETPLGPADRSKPKDKPAAHQPLWTWIADSARNLLVSGALLSAITTAVGIYVDRALDPSPVQAIQGAAQAREVFDSNWSELKHGEAADRPGLIPKIQHLDQRAEISYSRGQWAEAQAEYTALTQLLIKSCLPVLSGASDPTATVLNAACQGAGSNGGPALPTNPSRSYREVVGAETPVLPEIPGNLSSISRRAARLEPGHVVRVNCRFVGPVVGSRRDVWWYRITLPAGIRGDFASASAFYNGHRGPIRKALFYDPRIPWCTSPNGASAAG